MQRGLTKDEVMSRMGGSPPEPDAHPHGGPPCPGQSRSQGPALTPLDGTSPSGSFLPVVRAGSDHLNVVHPCGSRHGSQADRDPDWPLRPELAAPLGVWPLSQLAECAAGRRCWLLCRGRCCTSVLYGLPHYERVPVRS